MRPAPREPSRQLNAKSLPATNRRAASGLSTSARAEPAASNIKTTTANRVNIQRRGATGSWSSQYRLECMIRLPCSRSLVGPAGELVHMFPGAFGPRWRVTHWHTADARAVTILFVNSRASDCARIGYRQQSHQGIGLLAN